MIHSPVFVNLFLSNLITFMRMCNYVEIVMEDDDDFEDELEENDFEEEEATLFVSFLSIKFLI